MGEPPRRRVPIEAPVAGGRQGRAGCLAAGAVLGILVGATFAFYGLPPILRHFYGEKDVAEGSIFASGDVALRVAGVGTGPDPVCVGTTPSVSIPVNCPADSVWINLTVRASQPWERGPEDFRLEVQGIGRWIEALPPVAGVDDTRLRVEAGEERTVLLRFRLPTPSMAATAVLESLHIREPRARFALPPAAR